MYPYLSPFSCFLGNRNNILLFAPQGSHKSSNANPTNHVNRYPCVLKFYKHSPTTLNLNLRQLTCIALIMPTCAAPLAPPPPKTSPTDFPLIHRASLEKSEWMLGSDWHTLWYSSFCKLLIIFGWTRRGGSCLRFGIWIFGKTFVSSTGCGGATIPRCACSAMLPCCWAWGRLRGGEEPALFEFLRLFFGFLFRPKQLVIAIWTITVLKQF